MKIYNVASPYFSNTEKKRIIQDTQKVLEGRLSTGPYTKKFEKICQIYWMQICSFFKFLHECFRNSS